MPSCPRARWRRPRPRRPGASTPAPVAASAEVAAAADAMRDATARQKLVAKGVGALAREEAAARERKDLERLIEGFAARGNDTDER